MSRRDDLMPAESSRICLCVMFNHPLLSNIPLLRKIYSKRFSYVRFLVPFAQSDDEDVLTVYRGSFSHQAFVTDQRHALEELPCSHYILIHDDVMLSPWLDERNILKQLGIQSAAEGFIGAINPVPRDVGQWGFQAGSLWRMIYPRNSLSGTGVDTFATMFAQLPPLAEAAKQAEKYGIPAQTSFVYSPETLSMWSNRGDFFFFSKGDPAGEARFAKLALDLLFHSEPPAQLTFPYPVAEAGPNTDFIVVPRAALASYAHIAGVLAAAGLFVEMAAVTALILSCDHVRTASDGDATLIWSPASVTPTAALDFLENEESVLIHPVKLSRVEREDEFVARIQKLHEAAPAGGSPDMAAVLSSHPDFDADAYLALNPDVAEAGVSPFTHFRRHGRLENRAWKTARS